MTTYEDRSRGLDDLDVAISKALAACNCDFGPGLDPCYCTPSAVRALVERRDIEWADKVQRLAEEAEAAEARGAAKALDSLYDRTKDYMKGMGEWCNLAALAKCPTKEVIQFTWEWVMDELAGLQDEAERRARESEEGKP